MRISETGLRLIAAHEGFSPRPYHSLFGEWAIGFGHTYGVGEETPEITEADAAKLLVEDIAGSYGPAIDTLGLPLTQEQFDALCSFVYQLGIAVLAPSSPFGSHLRARDWLAAANAMLLYIAPDGTPLPELERRRALERALFLVPPVPAPTPLSVLNRAERHAVHRYDDLLAHAPVPADRLAGVREDLTLRRRLVWVAAVRGQDADGSSVPRGWGTDLRRERYELLAQLSGWER